jgi:signal transduction histidine kinase
MREATSETAHQSVKEIELVVADDGKACDIDFAAGSGMGLLGMRERIVALGGRLSFETGRPTGMILHAVIPAPS